MASITKSNTSKILPPLDSEVPVAVSDGRSKKGHWNCKVVRKGKFIGYCQFYQGCQAANPASILPCEGYWIEEIQGLELVV